jgi:hypothetical protein
LTQQEKLIRKQQKKLAREEKIKTAISQGFLVIPKKAMKKEHKWQKFEGNLLMKN